MDDFASETDSDYTSYWRDWVSERVSCSFVYLCVFVLSVCLQSYCECLLVILPVLPFWLLWKTSGQVCDLSSR